MSWIDWSVLAAYIAGSTWLAGRLAGKGQTIRDFFLGGRQLPWTAVCGSIIASEISGVTFVAVPAIAWKAGGNYTYLMLGVGSILARFIIGYVFVPAFYRHEIYSPYEFMGKRLGPVVDRACTAIFFLGAFLAQGARLFLAALVLDILTGTGVIPSILLLGAVSVVWTWMGGITSVVWTDVLQSAVLLVGAIVAVVAVVGAVPGGVSEVVRLGMEAHKFKVVDLTFDSTTVFTLWCGLFGSIFLTLGSHGTDQMMAQRLFCCRSEREARKAIIVSSVGILLAVVMLTVGVGLYAYYQKFPMEAGQAAQVRERSDKVFPLFILSVMPVGVKGLLFAAIFSAATATSTLSAMAQTALSAFYKPLLKHPVSEKHLVFVSRLLVLFSAVGLCGAAVLCSTITRYKNLLDLALAMAGYTYGAMLGILLLALLRARRDGRGLIWGVPLSIVTVFALDWAHQPWARYATLGVVLGLSLLAVALLSREPLKILPVLVAGAVALGIAFQGVKLAYPWYYPIGTLMTLGLGTALGRKRLEASKPAPVSSPP